MKRLFALLVGAALAAMAGVHALSPMAAVPAPPDVGTVATPPAIAYMATPAPTLEPGTTDCTWATAMLEEDARNDVANRPDPSASAAAYLDRAAAKWQAMANLLRVTVCAGPVDAGPQPDPSWYAGRQITAAGCTWALAGLDDGLRSHTEHQAAVDSGRIAPPWPGETVARSDAWDEQWAGNYRRLMALLGSACGSQQGRFP